MTLDTLDRLICRMVMHGHQRVWEYPWRLFVTAVSEAGKGP